MEKQQIFDLLKAQIEAGNVSRDELLAQISSSNLSSKTLSTVMPAPRQASRNLVNIFYAIGAVIALTGVIILLAQHWQEIGFVGRLLVTLGISVASYVVALLFRGPADRVISQVLFTLSAALAPLGVAVILDQAKLNFTLNYQLMVSLGLLILFAVAHWVNRRNILVILITGFATWAYYVTIFKIFNFRIFPDIDTLKFATMLAGLCYILIAYGYGSRVANPDRERSSVRGILYFLGTLAILGTGISMDDGWDIIFIAVLFAAFYASVFLRSRAMLVLAAIFLMAHIVKLTSVYFVNSIGWPVALVACGLIIIGIGYGTFQLNKKYLP